MYSDVRWCIATLHESQSQFISGPSNPFSNNHKSLMIRYAESLVVTEAPLLHQNFREVCKWLGTMDELKVWNRGPPYCPFLTLPALSAAFDIWVINVPLILRKAASLMEGNTSDIIRRREICLEPVVYAPLPITSHFMNITHGTRHWETEPLKQRSVK